MPDGSAICGDPSGILLPGPMLHQMACRLRARLALSGLPAIG